MWRWLVWFLTWLSGDPADMARESARAAASIAAARATMVAGGEPSPAPEPPAGKCCVECRGTGVIVHGDGHRTACPCPADCSCKKPKASCPDGQCPVPAALPTVAQPAKP
jgi:hypothetical protein